jgi:hypothetical protein
LARSALTFDPDTGFVYGVRGNPVGSRTSNSGYINISWRENGKRRCEGAHRLMWKKFKGDIPKDKVVDHINGDKTDNRLCNLRLVSVSENGAGVGRKKNKLPCGICLSSRGVYIVKFVRDKKRYYLGQTKDLNKAKKILREGLENYNKKETL